MATIASGTWDTPYKPRSKYKMYDTTVYVSHIFFEMNVDMYMYHGNGGDRQVIDSFLATDAGKWVVSKIKDPEVICNKNHVMARMKCIIRAYITPEDLMMYKLAFGAEACM